MSSTSITAMGGRRHHRITQQGILPMILVSILLVVSVNRNELHSAESFGTNTFSTTNAILADESLGSSTSRVSKSLVSHNGTTRRQNTGDTFRPVHDFDPIHGKQFWPVVPDTQWSAVIWDVTPNRWCPAGDSGSWKNKTSNPLSEGGIILVKVHKAASSTLAGVNLRIARNYYARNYPPPRNATESLLTPMTSGSANRQMRARTSCSSRQGHEDSRRYRSLPRNQSFVYTSIRDPSSRALSWFYYITSNQNISQTEETILNMFRQRRHIVGGRGRDPRNVNFAGAQAGFMDMGGRLASPIWRKEQPNRVQNLSLAIHKVQDLLHQYDFMVVVERLQESLVVLQLLLGLEPSDLLYVSSKVTGGFSPVWKSGRNAGCHQLHKPKELATRVQHYLSSSQWYASNYQDYLLYKAANQSLDWTIEALGRKRFESALSKYQLILGHTKDYCSDQAAFPCTSNGAPRPQNETNCYLRDWGCGYPCIDAHFA